MTDRRRIVITGVSRGLGRALTDALIARGHVVCGCARSRRAIVELCDAYPAPHRFDVVDVTDEPQVGRWAASVLDRAEPPHLVVNNAALINANAALWDVPVDEFSRVVDVNIKGVYHVIRRFVPAMIQRGRGVVVNFSSGWGRSTSPDVAPYCATKWAIEGLSRAMAAELPRGLAVVALNPGIVHTEMLDSCFGSSAAAYPDPQTWARAAVPLLLGLDASNNGEALTVPG